MLRTLSFLERTKKLFTKPYSVKKLALAFYWGLFIVFTPKNIFVDAMIAGIVFMFALPLHVVSLGSLVGLLCLSLLDPLFVLIGQFFLVEYSVFFPFWEFILAFPFVFLLDLNHTLMLGVYVFMLLFFFPITQFIIFLCLRFQALKLFKHLGKNE